jgi:hypothetical protein
MLMQGFIQPKPYSLLFPIRCFAKMNRLHATWSHRLSDLQDIPILVEGDEHGVVHDVSTISVDLTSGLVGVTGVGTGLGDGSVGHVELDTIPSRSSFRQR